MSGRAFSLVPFPAPGIPAISLTGTFSLADNVLKLHYALSGDTGMVFLPAKTNKPGRKNELWTATCFEFFLAIMDQPGYWEFNMSPSGDWNIFRMDSYRRNGFREEPAISELVFEVRKTSENIDMEVAVDLTPIFSPEVELQMAITAVIQTADGKESYWALKHPAPQADFHLRESFIPVQAGQRRPLGQSALAD